MPISMIQSRFFSLAKLSEGVFAAIAKKGAGAMSNAGIIDLGNEVVVFDTFTTPSAARDLRKAAEDLTQKEIKYVFNSHFHGDHTFGNQIFQDATIISTPATRDLHRKNNRIEDRDKELEETKQYLRQLKERAKTESDPVLLSSLDTQLKEMSKVCEAISDLEIVLPNLTFEEKLVIHGTDRTAEFYCFGGGHTESDAFLYIPEEKIAFMGDLVLENLHPPLFHSQEFKDNLLKVRQLDIERIVPGHGNIVTKNQIDVMIAYLTHLNEKVTRSIEKGMTLEELLVSEISADYAAWTGIDGYKRNLNAVYQEQNR
ncbi:MBL fold metallo-hydrolase [Heyndrickxia acidicola]|uniref:MBL fold metallo-hydrolase n=1 Tax=Heyndrickxia acidicola TaxID=209389 RepID=A0ABU6MIC6_9BACI|nr:MBL fold metallo-hydrolase [Heyndrickxia acidicola]MED1204424.1 MBL fold metallo-hydrolase [Heyndrickxia acidicola]